MKKIVGWVCIVTAIGLVITIAVVLITGAKASSAGSFLRVGIAVPIFLYYGVKLLRPKRVTQTTAGG
jgi:hypothetical protein